MDDVITVTAPQAAGMLNVSLPYLVQLLDEGKIESHTVGTQRRVDLSSLLQYMRRDDAQRRAAADELSALTQEMGPA